MKDYKKSIAPSKEGITAELEMHINDIPSISELQNDFTLDMMYTEMWNDQRLANGGYIVNLAKSSLFHQMCLHLLHT
jgi:hypothetical protein